MREKPKEFKPKPLEDVLDSLYMKFEVESMCHIPSSNLKLLASVIWYLEDLKEIKDKLKS